MSSSFVALDFETTGFSPNSSRVIEIGAVKYIEGKEVGRFETLVNPGVWSNSAARVHKIKRSEVESAPNPDIAFRNLFKFVGNNLIVAHNCSFERGFYENEARLIGFSVPNAFACTLQLSRRRISSTLVPNHQLQTVVTHLNLNVKGPLHRALPDADLCAQIWMALSNFTNKKSSQN